MTAILLSLTSSLVYGFSDFLGGIKSKSLPLLSVLLVSQAAALILVAGAVVVLGESPPPERYLLAAAGAGLCEAVGVAALYQGLAVGRMGVVAPIGAIAPVVPFVAAVVIGEPVSALQVAGIALVLAGIFALARTHGDGSGAIGPSVGFGLMTAAGFGGFLFLLHEASEGSVAWALLVARTAAVAAFVAAFLVARRPLAVPRAELPALVAVGALICGADALYAVATTKGLLSVVAVLSSLYPAVTIALARLVLQEPIGRGQQAGIALAFGGVAVIAATT